MNDNHERHLLVTFRHIDNLLSAAEGVLASAGSASPFAEHTQDSTPVQRKVIHDYIQPVREAMSRAMEDLNLPRPAPVCGALWAARGHITFASIAVAEMEPKRMRGYGLLSEVDSQAIDRVVAELNAALDALAAYLDKGPVADLQARLQKLDATHDEVPLLRESERIITGRGLVELRGILSMLLDRMENGSFEIGLFGRVSSGKSSLLNRLLSAEVLPVGVTPVTAIPTRVQFGLAPRAVVEFADRQPAQVGLSQLAEFSSEQQNPGNTKHVARIQVELPAARLRAGVTFVDTPGLGSLATSGAAETVAYLPRCDLGVVLVDAASTVTHEDLGIVQALCQAGAQATVLVSKADLLQPPEQERVLEYAREQLAEQLGVKLSVHPVSVRGAAAALCDQWFEHQLKPLLETHREQAVRSLKRKVGALRTAVANTLEVRLRATRGGAAPPPQATAEAITRLRNGDYVLEGAEKEAQQLIEETPRLAEAIVEAVAEGLAKTWRPHQGLLSNPASCGDAFRAVPAAHAAKLLQVFEALRTHLDSALAQARQCVSGIETDPLPKPSGLPLFDTADLTERAKLAPPAWARLLGAPWLRRYARTRVKEQLGSRLSESLDSYRLRLRPWVREALTELRAAFQARAGPLRIQLEGAAASGAGESNVGGIETELQRLRDWPA